MFARIRRPRLRPLENYRPVWLGVTALVVLVVVLAATLVVNSLGIGQRRVEADFAQAAQLEAGDQITVAGVPVGHVVGLRLAGDRVTVTMSIKSDVRLGADTTASIKLTTLLGNRFIEVSPAGSGSLPDGRIALAHTEVPYNLQSALEDVTTTFDQVDADKVGQAMTRLSTQLDGLPQMIPSVMQNVMTLSTVIAERRDQIGSLLTSTSQLTTVIEMQHANLAVLFTQGREVLQEFQSRRQSIEYLLSATTSVVRTLTPIAVDDQPEIRSLLDNLSSMMQALSQHDDLLRNILQVVPVPWRSWANLSGTGPELDANVPAGAFVDSFICALVGRAPQVDLPPYSKECK
ncbi:MCE family protein [Nocardia sp. NBC_00565]|uniref:MCE family protein n=1 Tax=Nocardia sp. NBC_00565 TaxID=2975993 RepID=UPI002E81A26B|nr:MCE family protein [Nocardia sp. NBC_00565]WUC01925.1 MCE family protein [Nocardia sp. NBC_00565]